MVDIDFASAPPPTAVGGLLAVPIHIQDLRATVLLDAASLTAVADATMTYAVGPTAGNPVFDLRQTVDRCWLDGVRIDPALISARDVGAGPFSTVRVLDVVQPTGSVHRLRVKYRLNLPRAQLGGAYPPALQWSQGPRLRWSFGMSDLNAGRYLESWFPSNLPSDRFPFTLDVQIAETPIAHALITNGAITTADTNAWSVQFPPWFTTVSPLLEIRASDTVEMASDRVALPASGKTITVEAWKLVGSSVDLWSRLAQIDTLLSDNETHYGDFLGDRFVCFFHGAPGGMEYNQATTTSEAAVSHETFHLWFARGVTPASQADGWWDEGFTRLHDDGADEVEPFDFREPPVELCSRQPFQRRTAANAYLDGSRFFRGIAAAIGSDRLRTVMREVYETHRGRPLSTATLEADIIAHTGDATLVDAFHRFVYGFADPSPNPRLWMKHAPGHSHADQRNEPFGDSPDLWVRTSNDGGTVHQPPERGRENWFYARVRNDESGGACRHFVVTFSVKEFTGTHFTYPGDFLPGASAIAAFDLPPRQTRVVSALWPRHLVPRPGTRTCVLASVHARGCHPSPGTHVWEQQLLAQKNVFVV